MLARNGCPHIPQTLEAVAPTCTESGLTEGEECILCGEILKEQEEVPATGHEFGTDGCLRCGLNYNLPVQRIGTDGTEYCLSVNDFVYINFRFSLDEDEIEAGGYVYFQTTYSDVYRTERVLFSDMEKGYDGKYAAAFSLAPREFANDMTVRLYNGDGSIASETLTASAPEYCNAILTGDYPDGDKDMVRALLNYMGYAQIYKGDATEETAVNAGLYEAGENPVSDVTDDMLTALQEDDQNNNRDGVTGIKVSETSLSLDSAAEVRYIAEFESGYGWDDFDVTVSDGFAFSASGEILTVEGISAYNLDKHYIVTIRNKADGTEMAFSNSALSIASRYLALEDEDLTNLTKALYLYNAAAKEYFGAKSAEA